MNDRVRIGVLGAARIVGRALAAPARSVQETAVTAIAARDPGRARLKAAKLGIPRVHDSYEALLADPDIDAVYIPLPNALHAPWSIRAMKAGKHVLCEKPIASNAQEAQILSEVSAGTGQLICEAMHSRYHAFYDRVEQILAAGALGEIRHVEARACFAIPSTKDIRWQYELGGGAVMDLGVYAVSVLRQLAGMEPTDVTQAAASTRAPGVDRRVDARLRFPNGATGRVLTSMWGWPAFSAKGCVTGSRGKLTVHNPTGPQYFNKIELEVKGEKRTERVAKRPDTYTCQLRAFADAVLRGTPLRTGPEHFVAQMRVIDAIYDRAGLPLRGTRLPA